MIPVEQKALTLCIALCDTVIYGTVWAEHKSALKLALAELLKAFLHRTSTKVSSSIFYRIATFAKVLLHRQKEWLQAASPLLLHLWLSAVETTLGSTLTPEMRGWLRRRERVKKEGVREKEVAYELQGERFKEKRERERLCVQLAIRLYRLDREQCHIRGRGNWVCACLCVKGEPWCQAWFHYWG